MSFQFLIDSNDVLSTDSCLVGGKAVGLARLGTTGSRVPPWFVVSTLAFERHLADAKAWPLLRARFAKLRGLDIDAPEPRATISAAASELRGEIEGAQVPAVVVAEIRSKLLELGAGPFAVRSSMCGEDSAKHSFAGQLESFLFQESLVDVVESVRKCWASAFSERVLLYRLRSDQPLELPRMGVVVQIMLDGDTSGVVFTAHPLSGRRDRSLITAAWGQGEGVVDGTCNTDEYVYNHEDSSEESHVIADKDRAVVALESKKPGTQVVDVDESRRRIRCLSPGDVAALGAQTRDIARAIGSPQDIEWTRVDGQFYMLQSRPITSLPSPENTSGAMVVFDNSNIQESYCGVTTPFTFSYASRSYETVYAQVGEILGVPKDEIERLRPVLKNLLALVRGRIYYNINNWYRKLLVFPSFGRNKEDMERMMGLEEPVDFVKDEKPTLRQRLSRLPGMVRVVVSLMRRFRRLDRDVELFHERFESVYKEVDRAALAHMDVSEILTLFGKIWKRAIEKWHTPIVGDTFVMMSMGRLRRFVERSGVEDPGALINSLLAGEDEIESSVPTRLLMGIARDIRVSEGLARLLTEGGPLEALAAVKAESPEIARRIDEYIERYGDRVMGELKFETVTLREDPSFLVRILRNYLSRPDLDPDRIALKEKEQRAEAERRLRSSVGPLARMRIGKILKNARKAVKHRESMRLARTRGFGLVRDIVLAIGDRFVEAGKLEARRDVFFLTIDEIEAYHDGRSVCADLEGLVAVRKKEFEQYEKLGLPHRFETVGPVYHGNRYEGPASKSVDPFAMVLKGTGCYPGIVERPVRVILDPADELSVNDRILATVRTDPGWAPLFPTTSGILVERGGTLSHSAVVARELGIPTIVGIPGLLEIIADGETVRMNGDTGIVERLSPSDGVGEEPKERS